jgi:hypothetical protein
LHFNELTELMREQNGPLKCITMSQMSKSSFMTTGATLVKNDDCMDPAQISKISSCESRYRAKSQEQGRVYRLKSKYLNDQSQTSPKVADNRMESLKERLNQASIEELTAKKNTTPDQKASRDVDKITEMDLEQS